MSLTLLISDSESDGELLTNEEHDPSTTILNESFSESIKKLVWVKGKIIAGYPADKFRYDICGNVMAWKDYGDRHAKYGWEIDHIVPKSMRDVPGFEFLDFDNINNLQPLYWRNNASKSDQFPWPYPPYKEGSQKR